MKQAKYRAEAFIVPVCVDTNTNSILSETNVGRVELNEFVDRSINIEEKETNCIKNHTDNLLFSTEEESLQNLKNSIIFEKNIIANHVDSIEENQNTSANFYSSLSIPKIKHEVLYNASFSSNIFNKVQRLTPIDEKHEDAEEKLTDLCYHGCKNGCSATVPTPQEVSEEVFKENWLQKLEDIKRKEAELKNREIILQNREKALFKKEKEIKTLEHKLSDKLKQIDLHLKEHKYLQGVLRICNSQKNSLESLSADYKLLNNIIAEKVDNAHINNFSLSGTQIVSTQDSSYNQLEQLNKQLNNNIETTCKDLQEKECSGSSCSSDLSTFEGRKSKPQSNFKSSITLKARSKITSNNSNKLKKCPMICYEDLDTTLSADIGDSSFVQTSQKFNPKLYKKPYVFTRSASERRGKYASKGSNLNFQVQNLGSVREEFDAPVGIEQGKVLDRVTKNISASQDKNTKFQNYGLIDHNTGKPSKVPTMENEKKYSYLDLETGSRLYSHQRLIKNTKDRPMSWNEETNEWLQKKRKAYNMTAKKVLENTENKENHKCGTKTDKTEKVIKRSDLKNKILTIFR